MKMSARILNSRLFQFVLLLLFGLLLAFPSLSFAQNPQTSQQEFYNSVEPNVTYDINTKTQVMILGLSNALLCQLSGIDLMNPEKGCLTINPFNQKIGYLPQDESGKPIQTGGLVLATSELVDIMYHQPISSSQYTSYLADNFGITKKASAQEDEPVQDTRSGFEGFSSILSLFVTVRNIVYLLMTLAFIIVGLGIMLRIHIDPRTVMTIQNQIPKLIIALITITFSYAIAGLLVDTMWIFTFFGINTITESAPICEYTNIGTAETSNTMTYVATSQILNNPLSFAMDLFNDTGCHGFGGITGIAKNASLTISDILSRSVLELFQLNTDELDNCNLGWSIFWSDAGDCAKLVGFAILKYLVGAIFLIILFFSIIIALFKTWFMLLKAYISILLAVILAPLWIILGVIPGGGMGFGQWMRHMVSHLAIFPAAALMYTLAAVIAASPDANDPQMPFLPPLIGNPNIADNAGWLVALGFILLTPDLLPLIRDALKSPQGKYTGNIFGRAKSGNPTSSIAAIGGFGYSLGGISSLTGKIPFLNKASEK